VILGLILALGSAAATNVAFLFKHRGAVLAPPVRVRHPLRSATDLLRSRWFLVGWLVAVFGFGLHDPVPENGSDSGYPGAHCTGTVTYTAPEAAVVPRPLTPSALSQPR